MTAARKILQRLVDATTDEQIEKLKEKAEADRSFGFESINGRKA